MKLALFNDYALGVVSGDTLVDVSSAVADLPRGQAPEVMHNLIGRFGDYRDKIAAAAASGKKIALSDVKLRAPLPRPCNIDCMAANYNDGMFATDHINAFHKTASGVIGPDEAMVLPDLEATIFEAEPELGVIIGKRAENVSEADAMSHVFGYVNFVDGSARGVPHFFQMKSRATFAPLGPYLVTADEIPDPHKLRIRSWTNGQLMHDFGAAEMAHSIKRCISWLSSIHVLEPGSVIATGTHHVGLNPVMDGDVWEMETEGLGRMRIKIRDDLKRTWARVTRGELKHLGSNITTPQVTGKYAGTKA